MAKKAKAGAKVAVPDHNRRAPNQDPLHGVTLKRVRTRRVEKYCWEELGNRINFNC
ncbi:MAG: VF530 family DNA-binding protein, partial [Gammaproteobacteria bacterium]|nr:VF530 family DNA-binding protein [Gammaproteobacteria bacterium]